MVRSTAVTRQRRTRYRISLSRRVSIAKGNAVRIVLCRTHGMTYDAEVDAAMEQLFNTLRDKFNGTTR